MNKKLILKTQHIVKNFSSTRALRDVSIDFYGSEIKGLIGENGSGKSTLSSIISGVYKQDGGTMEKDGVTYEPHNIIDSQKKGITMVAQEMGTIPDISVAANIFIGNEGLFRKGRLIDRKKMNFHAAKILAQTGIDNIDPAAITSTLSLEDRKLVEIAKATYQKPDVLIIDETTTALSQKGRQIIYKIMDQLRNQGKAVIFISHDLDELKSICDSITILRDGTFIKNLSKEEIDIDTMKRLMIGRDISDNYYRSDYEPSYSKEVVFSVRNLSGKIIKDFSEDLHEGEILGIGGLTDCGMHELGKLMFGVEKAESGKVCIKKGTWIPITSARKAIQNKIGYVSKDRDLEALILNESVKDNISQPSYDLLRKGPFITKQSEKAITNEQVAGLKIKCSSINQYCMYLSGGNKQKVVIGKWLGNKSNIFILDCPTRGIDIGVKEAIYNVLSDLKSEGKSIIMISEELPELIGMSDRLIIIKDGAKVKTFDRSKNLTESEVIKYMI